MDAWCANWNVLKSTRNYCRTHVRNGPTGIAWRQKSGRIWGIRASRDRWQKGRCGAYMQCLPAVDLHVEGRERAAHSARLPPPGVVATVQSPRAVMPKTAAARGFAGKRHCTPPAGPRAPWARPGTGVALLPPYLPIPTQPPWPCHPRTSVRRISRRDPHCARRTRNGVRTVGFLASQPSLPSARTPQTVAQHPLETHASPARAFVSIGSRPSRNFGVTQKCRSLVHVLLASRSPTRHSQRHLRGAAACCSPRTLHHRVSTHCQRGISPSCPPPVAQRIPAQHGEMHENVEQHLASNAVCLSDASRRMSLPTLRSR